MHCQSGSTIDVCLIATSEIDIGVRSLSAFLKSRGYSVALGLFDKWGVYSREDLESIVAWVRALSPAVIGVSSVEFSRERTFQLMAALKSTGKTIVAGGVDPAADPAGYLRCADYVVRGEGEHALLEMLNALRSGEDPRGIANLCYRHGDGCVTMNRIRPLIPDINELPFEDWLDTAHHYELAASGVRPKRDYALRPENTMRMVSLFTMRGCAFTCSFCINSLAARADPALRVRKRTIASVIEQAARFVDEGLPIDEFSFHDDDFFLRSLDEIREFGAAWKRRIGKGFNIHGSPVTVTEEKLACLVDAGLVVVTAGIQTGSERVNADIYDRKMNTGDIMRMAGLLQRYVGKGPSRMRPPFYCFIINNPYEQVADLLATVTLIGRLPKPFHVCIFNMKFFRGTTLYERAKRDGLVAARDASAKYNYHDTLNNFKAATALSGEQYYLNSLLYWMGGLHARRVSGIVPPVLRGLLTNRKVISLFGRNRRLVDTLNRALPTQERLTNARYKAVKYMRGAKDAVRSFLGIGRGRQAPQ